MWDKQTCNTLPQNHPSMAMREGIFQASEVHYKVGNCT